MYLGYDPHFYFLCAFCFRYKVFVIVFIKDRVYEKVLKNTSDTGEENLNQSENIDWTDMSLGLKTPVQYFPLRWRPKEPYERNSRNSTVNSSNSNGRTRLRVWLSAPRLCTSSLYRSVGNRRKVTRPRSVIDGWRLLTSRYVYTGSDLVDTDVFFEVRS